MNPVEIVPRLYLSSQHASSTWEVLESLKVSHIVNMASECKNFFPEKIEYFNGNLEDMQEEDIGEIIQKVADFIDNILKQESGTVLVHCQAGISRSTTMILGYLIKHKKMGLKEAFFMVKQKKPNVGPNRGYMQQLCDLETKVLGSATFSMEEFYIDEFVQWGFSVEKAKRALKETDHNFDLALDLLLSY